jgi:hypothetical protein
MQDFKIVCESSVESRWILLHVYSPGLLKEQPYFYVSLAVFLRPKQFHRTGWFNSSDIYSEYTLFESRSGRRVP